MKVPDWNETAKLNASFGIQLAKLLTTELLKVIKGWLNALPLESMANVDAESTNDTKYYF